jgi:hypothetical protein
MQKYYLNNKEVSEEEFYSKNNLSVSNPFRGEKQVNEAVKEAIGLSTRHKAGEKMTYLDEVLDNFREDDSPAIKFAERLAQQDERLKEIKDLAKNGVKETEGKVDYSEIDWDFIESQAKRMNKNKNKYPAGNFKKKMNVEELKQSLLRHVLEVLKGNYEDDGDELGHLAAIALNAQMINYQLKNK